MTGIATRISWDSFNGLLPDGDIINVSIEPDALPPEANAVDFRLEAGEGITWWKGLLVPDGIRSSWEPWTKDSRTSDSVALWAFQVHNGQSLEFKKAGWLGIHGGVYLLDGLDRLPPNSRVTFRWAQDKLPDYGCYPVDVVVDLPLRDGTYRAAVGQSFHAAITYRNWSETRWTADARYRLGSWAPQDNTTWGINRVPLGVTGHFDFDVVFDFTATAPARPGRYEFVWRMVQEGVTWFGGACKARHDILVEGPYQGTATVELLRQGPASLAYDGVAVDPTDGPDYGSPYHAVVESVTNQSDTPIYLAHQTSRQSTSYTRIPGHGQIVAPFAGLEVEGLWRAQFRGNTPPGVLLVAVAWRTP